MVALELIGHDILDQPRSRVDPEYVHRPKRIQPGEAIVNDELVLKWYDLVEIGQCVDGQASADARAFVDWVWDGQQAAGFVIHHPCAGGTYLVASRWDANNELWDQVWWRAEGEIAFEAVATRNGMQHSHCLWQLPIVAHEAAAWSRFLCSDRSGAAFDAWFVDEKDGITQ